MKAAANVCKQWIKNGKKNETSKGIKLIEKQTFDDAACFSSNDFAIEWDI